MAAFSSRRATLRRHAARQRLVYASSNTSVHPGRACGGQPVARELAVDCSRDGLSNAGVVMIEGTSS